MLREGLQLVDTTGKLWYIKSMVRYTSNKATCFLVDRKIDQGGVDVKTRLITLPMYMRNKDQVKGFKLCE